MSHMLNATSGSLLIGQVINRVPPPKGPSSQLPPLKVGFSRKKSQSNSCFKTAPLLAVLFLGSVQDVHNGV